MTTNEPQWPTVADVYANESDSNSFSEDAIKMCKAAFEQWQAERQQPASGPERGAAWWSAAATAEDLYEEQDGLRRRVRKLKKRVKAAERLAAEANDISREAGTIARLARDVRAAGGVLTKQVGFTANQLDQMEAGMIGAAREARKQDAVQKAYGAKPANTQCPATHDYEPLEGPLEQPFRCQLAAGHKEAHDGTSGEYRMYWFDVPTKAKVVHDDDPDADELWTVKQDRVDAFRRGWHSVPQGKPGDRTRAGLAAVDEWKRSTQPEQYGPEEHIEVHGTTPMVVSNDAADDWERADEGLT